MGDLLCDNTVGSFECVCPPGTTPNGTDCLCKKYIRSCLSTPIAIYVVRNLLPVYNDIRSENLGELRGL